VRLYSLYCVVLANKKGQLFGNLDFKKGGQKSINIIPSMRNVMKTLNNIEISRYFMDWTLR